jgi:hypothetical protein
MKRSQFAILAFLQLAVIVFLALALTQGKLVWYLAAAFSVTILFITAAVLGLRHLFPSE